jgi:DNA-binding transcriptional LysR family regulator
MNMKQLKYIQVLASVGSFSKASELLNIKQPSLSQYIKKIEQDVGAELFDRAGGNVTLTDAGRTYIQVGRQILELEHQLESQLCDIADYKAGTITVGLSAHRSVALMPRIVKQFKELYPGIVLHIEERKRYEILDAAEHGEFDLCLTTLPINSQLFSYETAFIEENVLAVPEYCELNSVQMHNRKFPAVSVDQINNAHFAALNEEHPMQHELKQLCEKNHLNILPTVVCTSLEALIEMVKVGMGYAFIPSCMAKETPGVRFYSIVEETCQREIIVMYRKEQYLSEPVLKLKELLKQ